MNIATLALGEHVAHLDPMNGTGMLVMPDWPKDVRLDAESLYEADWTAALTGLAAHGFKPLTDEADCLVSEGADHDGRVAVSLIATETEYGEPNLDALTRSWDALSVSVGLIRA